MQVWRFGLPIVQLLKVKCIRKNCFDDCFESAAIFNFVVNGSRSSIGIDNTIGAFNDAIALLALPMIQHYTAVWLINVVAK